MRSRPLTVRMLATALAITMIGCSDSRSSDDSSPDMASAASDSTGIGAATPAEEQDPWLHIQRLSKWTGDLDGMAERGFLRLLTVYSPTQYFVDGARERGIIAEYAPVLERFLNQRLRAEEKRISVVIIPVRRDQLLPFLVDELGDVAVGNLTITENLLALVDFTNPSFTDVQELVITGPDGPR